MDPIFRGVDATPWDPGGSQRRELSQREWLELPLPSSYKLKMQAPVVTLLRGCFICECQTVPINRNIPRWQKSKIEHSIYVG